MKEKTIKFAKRIQEIFKQIISYKHSLEIALIALPCIAVIFSFVSINKVTVVDGVISTTVYTYNNSIEAVLDSAGISVDGDDLVKYDDEGNIIVTRKFPVKVIKGTEELSFLTAKGTVADLFKANGIVLTEEDEVNCKLDDALYEGMTITVTDIETIFEEVVKVISYQTKTVYTTALKKGQTRVVGGVNGEKVLTYRKKIVNGEVAERVYVTEMITILPTDKTTYIGTGEADSTGNYSDPSTWVSKLTPDAPIELDANGKPLNYKKVISGIASAYSPIDGLASATGVVLKPGYVAVDPNKIPYGSKLYIRTQDGRVIYGYAVAADTGGFVTLYPHVLVDLFFPSEQQASDFGLKNVDIFILE